MSNTVHLGFELGSGKPVAIPLRHMVVTGQTQEAGKTTTLEALIARAGVKALAFVTKRGEGSFHGARSHTPYFREQADWKYVAAILEASRGEKMRFERPWIIRASKGARTLADVQRTVKKLLADPKTKGLTADVYLTLDAYLDDVVPYIDRVTWAQTIDLGAEGLTVMDLGSLTTELQHLVIRSSLEWVLKHAEHTVVVVPEAWKFIPQGRGTPVKLAAEEYIRQAAGLGNYLWLDSQDIAGVEKIILKSVPVWILGVQRESNEVKRTLDQIPAGIKKPKPEQVATLGLGEFYACYGTHITKVYVQPKWMGQAEAVAIAEGKHRAESARGPVARRLETMTSPEERTVDEREAKALREENAALKSEVGELRRRLEAIEALGELKGQMTGRTVGKQGAKKPEAQAGGRGVDVPPSPSPVSPIPEVLTNDDLYDAIKRRLIAEAPGLLRVLATAPELEVTVKRETVQADGSGWVGRAALLLKDGYFKTPRPVGETHKELLRRGANGLPARTSEALKSLLAKGFLTLEDGGYREVQGMKVRIVEAA